LEHGYSLYPILRTDKPNKAGLCPLYLRYTYKRQWKNLALKKTLEASFWNIGENEPRKNCPNRSEILNLIRTQKTLIESKILAFSREFGEYPSPDELLSYLDINRKAKKDWDYYYDDFVSSQRTNENVEAATLQIYKELKNKLISFIKDQQLVWSWNSIGTKFYNDFVYYLRTVKLRNGKIGHTDAGIGKHIKTLKTFFSFVSVKYGIINSNQYRNFKTLREEPDFVVLNDKDIELMKSSMSISYMMKNKIQLNNREYLIVRLMLLLCKTGMNISDLLELKVSHIFKHEELGNNEVDQTRKQSITELSKDRLSKIANARLYIKKNRQKLKNINKKKIPVITITDELATLLSLSFKKQKEQLKEALRLYHKDPFFTTENYSVFSLMNALDDLKDRSDDEKKDLFHNYPYFLEGINEVAFNREVKLVLKKIGLDYETVIYKNTSKNKVEEVLVPKYELISSRTGRRSYITDQLARNVPITVIMRSVGITKPDTLKRYENLSDKTIVDIVKKANKVPQKLRK
jgi:site-specific recombinase XerD